MIITFSNQKGGVGKSTLAMSFANFLALDKKEVIVYDFDYQKTFYNTWVEDGNLTNEPPLYNVINITEDNVDEFSSYDVIEEMKNSNIYHIFDLGGTLSEEYTDLLIFSDYIVIPIEYSDMTVKSTMQFITLLGMLESQARRVFVRNRYDMGYLYRTQEEVDSILSEYGIILNNIVYKRNILQSITTRGFNKYQKIAVEKVVKELIEVLNKNK